MNILLFYIKEIYFKLIYFILLLLVVITTVLFNFKYAIIYILSPIKQIKTQQLIAVLSTEQIDKSLLLMQEQYHFLPIVEINLPFLATSYIYLKYVFLISFYFSIPIYLYFYKLNLNRILKNKEVINLTIKIKMIMLSLFFNFLINHYLIVPFFLNFTFNNYNEYLFYEFDVELQLFKYLDFYFKLLYFNCVFLFMIALKKNLNNNVLDSNILILLLLFLLPLDLIIQILYTILLFIYSITFKLINNYYTEFKKYK